MVKKAGTAADKVFYEKIWDNRKHVCYETGEFLGLEPRTYMFHHVLEKEKFPKFRHREWNVVLVTGDVHTLAHSNIDKTPRIKKLRAKLLKKYVYGSDNES